MLTDKPRGSAPYEWRRCHSGTVRTCTDVKTSDGDEKGRKCQHGRGGYVRPRSQAAAGSGRRRAGSDHDNEIYSRVRRRFFIHRRTVITIIIVVIADHAVTLGQTARNPVVGCLGVKSNARADRQSRYRDGSFPAGAGHPRPFKR